MEGKGTLFTVRPRYTLAMKRLAIRWAILPLIFALLYFTVPVILQYLETNAPRPVQSISQPELPAPIPAPTVTANVHSQPNYDGVCRARENKPAPKPKSEIYTWVDANGRTHFGDSLQSKTAKRVEVAQTAGAEFSLKVNDRGSTIPLDFRNQLEVRIRKSYSVMEQLLPEEAIRASTVNLWVFGSNEGYERFKQQHAPGLSGTSTGFHSSRQNIAAVWHKSDEQLMRTSIHEAAHVNNWAMLGRTPTWLNEGIAEYLERLNVYAQAAEITPNRGWLRTLKKESLRLPMVLRSTHEDWRGEQRNALYAHSWAFVYFLLGETDTRDLLKSYLAATAAQPCMLIDFISYSESNFAGGFSRLKADFSSWQPDKALAHVY